MSLVSRQSSLLLNFVLSSKWNARISRSQTSREPMVPVRYLAGLMVDGASHEVSHAEADR